jgi:hypothetical protein
MENVTTPAPIETPVDAPVQETKGESTGGGDAYEGFSAWLASKSKSEPAPESKEVAKEKQPETSDTEEVKEDAPKTEEPVKSSIKVGEKEYTEESIKELETSMEDFKAQVSDFIQALRTSPGEIFDKLEISKETLEEYYYHKYVEPNTLSAEEKLAKYEQRDKEAKEKAAQEERSKKESSTREAQRQKWLTDIQNTIVEAKLPNNDFTITRVAAHAKQALSQGQQVDLKQIAAKVRQELLESQSATLGSMSPEELSAALGKETLDKLRKSATDKFKESKFQNTNPGKGEIKTESKSAKRTVKSVYDLLD